MEERQQEVPEKRKEPLNSVIFDAFYCNRMEWLVNEGSGFNLLTVVSLDIIKIVILLTLMWRGEFVNISILR